VILFQIYVTKFQLKYLKLGFKCKNKSKHTEENYFHHSSLPFFEFSSSLLLEYGRKFTIVHVDFFVIFVIKMKHSEQLFKIPIR